MSGTAGRHAGRYRAIEGSWAWTAAFLAFGGGLGADALAEVRELDLAVVYWSVTAGAVLFVWLVTPRDKLGRHRRARAVNAEIPPR